MELETTLAPPPETVASLKQQSTFTPAGTTVPNWDFTLGTGVWGVNGYTSSGLVNNGLPYFQWQYPTQAQITPTNQTLTYSGTVGTLDQTQYTVNYASGYSSLSTLLSSGPILSVVGSNVNVVNSGAVNTIAVSLVPLTGDTIEIATVPATLTYTPATLTYTANTATTTYGQAPTLSGTVTGFVNGQNEATATTGTLSFTTPATVFSNVGSYAVNGSGLTANNGNYTFTQASGNANALSITQATVTVSASTGETKIYGQSAANVVVPNPEYTVTGLVNGDTFTGYSRSSAGDVATANTGTYTVTVGGGTGGLNSTSSGLPGGTFANDYTVVYAPTGNALTVNPAMLTYTANAATTTYGQAPTLSGTVSGFVNGQNQATATTGTLSFTTPVTVFSNVGSHAVNGSGLTANSGNYTFTQASGNANALSITQATVTVSANTGETKTYGQTAANVVVPNTAFTITGLVNGDTFTGSTRTSTGDVATANTGTYTVTASGGTGGLNSTSSGLPGGTFANDYTVVYAPTSNALTVNPATLTYAANPVSIAQKGTLPPLTGTVTGFVNTDNLANATVGTALFTTLATSNSPVGFYAINGSGLTAGNYVFVQAAGNARALAIANPLPVQTVTVPFFDLGSFEAQGYTAGQGIRLDRSIVSVDLGDLEIDSYEFDGKPLILRGTRGSFRYTSGEKVENVIAFGSSFTIFSSPKR